LLEDGRSSTKGRRKKAKMLPRKFKNLLNKKKRLKKKRFRMKALIRLSNKTRYSRQKNKNSKKIQNRHFL
jgi:hypothetical protein